MEQLVENETQEYNEVEQDEDIELDDQDIEDEIRYESVEETARRAIEEAKTQKSSEADEQNDGRGNEKNQFNDKQGQAKTANTGKQSQEVAAQIFAPERFSAEAKAAWKNTPKPVQEQYAKTIRDLENGQRQRLQQIESIKKDAETVVGAVKPWAKDWAANGITVPQGVALLAQTHERMVENPAKEIARLVKDNGITIEDIQAVMEGRTPDAGNGQGSPVDISSHPEFKALQEKVNRYDNERYQQQANATVEKIKALREQTDANGVRPYEHILNPQFLEYAQPLVNALRTPPRGQDGKFTGPPPVSIEDAYKRAYFTWTQEHGTASQGIATSPQPQQTATTTPEAVNPRKSEPIAMRSRNRPVGARVTSQGDPKAFMGESVEETVARLKSEGFGA